MIEFECETTGIFKSEIKNRFRSIVLIEGKEVLCYIQSSSRLSNYVDLKNKKVLLTKTKNGKKIKYTVYAKKIKRDFMLLCPSLANEIIHSELNRRFFSFLGNRKDAMVEHTVNNYKTDIFLSKEKTIIEIKSHISDKDNLFPTVFSERTLIQLDKFNELISLGYKCVLMIVSFDPYIKEIRINKDTKFYSKISELLSKHNDFIIKAYSITLKAGIKVKGEIPINI